MSHSLFNLSLSQIRRTDVIRNSQVRGFVAACVIISLDATSRSIEDNNNVVALARVCADRSFGGRRPRLSGQTKSMRRDEVIRIGTLCADTRLYRHDRTEVTRMLENGRGGPGEIGVDGRWRGEDEYIEGSAALISSQRISRTCLRPSSTCDLQSAPTSPTHPLQYSPHR